MMTTKEDFSVGNHRPVYLWGGPGTVRMNSLKFMGAQNDEKVHAEAHTDISAKRMAKDAGFNWAYLMYDWGFPPEIAEVDWADFQVAVSIYKRYGVKVFGYIQTSNCVYDGSFKDKSWYALDPKGRKIFYYTGRYMTCWLHPEWMDHLKEMILGVLQLDADGVFLDNPWMGVQPLQFGGTWSGPAGCYCHCCRTTFSRDTGMMIPTQINPETCETSRSYLKWRADIVSSTMESLADYARSLKTGVVVSINDYDTIMHPTYISHGIDLPTLAKCQDVVMIEDFCLPRWTPGELVNNTITIRTALALTRDTPLTTNPYDKGIGFDEVYPPRRFLQGMAEAAACGTPMVVKGTEYIDEDGIFTLLTASEYTHQRSAIKKLQSWLAEHANLYKDRRNLARIGILYPTQRFKTHWDQTANLYFGVCQTFTYAGIPWRVVTEADTCDGLGVIICLEDFIPSRSGIKTIDITQQEGWSFPQIPFLAKHGMIRKFTSVLLGWFYRSYFQYRWSRWITDMLGIPQWFLGSPHFQIPPTEAQTQLLDSVDEWCYPCVSWDDAPVLIEIWQRREEAQVHLVNYGDKPQKINLKLSNPANGVIISPESENITFDGVNIEVMLDIYSILRYKLIPGGI